MTTVCFFTGQQTLSEEVSERTHSRMLKLEKENQVLLKTIEELRAETPNSSTKTKHNFTSLVQESSVLQTSCTVIENHADESALDTLTQRRKSTCHQQLHAEELEGVKSEIPLSDNEDCHQQENAEKEDQRSEEHLHKIVSDLEVLENNNNRVHCLVGTYYHSPGSKSSIPGHDNIMTGLPPCSSYSSKHTQRLEAKCRTLTTVNHQLQASLENTGGFFRSVLNILHILVRLLFTLLHFFRPKSSTLGSRGSGAGS